MEFRNALTILFTNIGYVVKILLWIIISLIITAAVGAAILIPLWKVFASTTDVVALGNVLMQTVKSVWSGSLNLRVAIFDLVPQIIGVLRALASNPAAMTGLVFTIILLYAIFSFLAGMSFYTVADIINKLMASNLRFGFASNMALNFKKCCRFSFARLLIALPIDLVCFVIGVFLAYGLFTVIKLFTLPIILIIAILFCTLRSMLFSGWLPRILHHPEERLFTSFSRSFTFVKSNFGELFKAYFLMFVCVYLIAAVFSVPTGGIIILVLPSIYYFLSRAVELVGYYRTKHFSFYVDRSTVVNTVEYGYRDRDCSRCINLDCENCSNAPAKEDSEDKKAVETDDLSDENKAVGSEPEVNLKQDTDIVTSEIDENQLV
ncbi:MAG: hypothetical protein NC037_03750 [Bacteroides sp.]|nr:hypothetical protein [Bacillota bacterium]MCM1394224.1 hypothetical protein [[Eubacterium] siraeum]MCM1455624.1 hypothetical protein [Bacteroides sp.]